MSPSIRYGIIWEDIHLLYKKSSPVSSGHTTSCSTSSVSSPATMDEKALPPTTLADLSSSTAQSDIVYSSVAVEYTPSLNFSIKVRERGKEGGGGGRTTDGHGGESLPQNQPYVVAARTRAFHGSVDPITTPSIPPLVSLADRVGVGWPGSWQALGSCITAWHDYGCCPCRIFPRFRRSRKSCTSPSQIRVMERRAVAPRAPQLEEGKKGRTEWG